MADEPQGILEFAGRVEETVLVVGTTTSVDQLLPFRATMVLADNFTNQYVRIAPANTWVPPQAQGYRVLLPQGSQKMQAAIEAPPGITAAATVAGQVCNLKWLEKPIITSAVSQQVNIVTTTAIGGGGVMIPWTPTPVTPYTVATGDAIALQPATTGQRFGGFAVAETAGATARVTFYNATSANPATAILEVPLVANEGLVAEYGGLGGVDLAGGLFVARSGSVRVSWLRKTVATA